MTAPGNPFDDLIPRRRDEDRGAFDDLVPARRATDRPYRHAGGREGLKALPGILSGVARSALQGATLGFSDELAGGVAGLGALVPGGRSPAEAYRAERDRVREAQRAFEAVAPVGSTVLEMGGAVVPALLTGGASAAPGALSTAGKAIQGAKVGAKVGALYGLGKAEGSPVQQGAATVAGGVLGGAAGAALPLVGAAVKGGKAAVTRTVAKRPGAIGQAAQQQATTQGRAQGASLVLRALEREGLTPADAQARVQAARFAGVDDVALPDIAPGGNVRGLLDLAATRPGAAQTAVRTFTERRAGGMRQTMANALDEATGLPPRNLFQLKQELVQARDKAAGEVFEPLFRAVDYVDDPGVIQAVQTVEQASGRFAAFAKNLARLHGVPTDKLVVQNAPPKVRELLAKGASPAALEKAGIPVGTAKVPSLRYVHYLKEGVDREIGREMALVNKGQSKSRLAGLQRLKDRLREATTTAVPEYGEALRQYAGDSEVLRAMELGKRLLYHNTDPVEITTVFQAMTPSEQDVFRMAGSAAARQFLQGKAALAPTPTNAWWNNPAIHAKLRLLFPNEAGYRRFMDAVAVTRQKALTGQAGGNSLTASRLFADQDLMEQLAGGITPGDVPIVGGVIPRLIRGGLRKAEAALKERALTSAAPYLTATGAPLDDQLRTLAVERALLAPPAAAARGRSQAVGGWTGRTIGQATETREPRRPGPVGVTSDTMTPEAYYQALLNAGVVADQARSMTLARHPGARLP